jgi:mannosyltransferase
MSATGRHWLVRFETLDQQPVLQHALLGVIVLVATLLRFHHLGTWSFWLDEVISVNASAYIAEWPLAWLPLFLVAERITLDLLGTSEWSARLFPALVGIVTIPALYYLIRKPFGATVALLALLFLALSPWHVYWSQNARFYTLLLLLYNLGLLLFLIGFREKRLSYLVASTILLVLAMRERQTALFSLPVIFIYIAWNILASNKTVRTVRPYYLMPVFIPIGAFAIYELINVFYLGNPSRMAEFYTTFAGNPNQTPLRLLLSIVFRLSIPIICLAVVGGLILLLQRDEAGKFILAGAVVPTVLLLGLSTFMFTADRYIFMVLPFWCILAAVSIRQMFVAVQGYNKLLPLGVLALLVLSQLGDNMLYYQFQNGNRPNWGGALAFIEQRIEPQDLIFATNPEVGNYYLNTGVSQINSANPVAIAQEHTRAWFVIEESIGWVAPDLEQWITQHGRLMSVFDTHMPGKSLTIRIYLYEPELDR